MGSELCVLSNYPLRERFVKSEPFGNLNVYFILLCFEGKLERTAVLKAVCAGFKEATEPRICLSGGLHY